MSWISLLNRMAASMVRIVSLQTPHESRPTMSGRYDISAPIGMAICGENWSSIDRFWCLSFRRGRVKLAGQSAYGSIAVWIKGIRQHHLATFLPHVDLFLYATTICIFDRNLHWSSRIVNRNMQPFDRPFISGRKNRKGHPWGSLRAVTKDVL